MIDTFNIIAGLITILSFVFSLLVWMRSDMKVRELSGVLETIHDIVGTAIWESQMSLAESKDIKLRQVERVLGYVSSIRKLTGRFSGKRNKSIVGSEIDQLLERGIVWTFSTLWKVEASSEITEVWLATPDLKPDSSDPATGRLVNRNLKRGVNYMYFYPADLVHADKEIARLYKNIGLSDSTSTSLENQVKLVPLNREQYSTLFTGGSIVLYYRDQQRSLLPRCFEEVVFTKVPERGAFWQEHAENRSKEIRHLLERGLEDGLNQLAIR